jgi:glyoxylase-like metal-dependent hydrolase (beta-lactamase superfamily II)
VFVPPGQAEAVRTWDTQALSYGPSGQRCERFVLHGVLSPGDLLDAGGRQFEVLAAPGHDPHSVVLFDRHHGLLISADALWENGFGVVFPELEGESAFDDVGAVLDLIEKLPVTLVVPGHGGVFSDVPAALSRARSRLAAFKANPLRHARYAAKVLLSYHLLEEHSTPLAHLREWAERTPLFLSVWSQAGSSESEAPGAWSDLLVGELVAGGVARRVGDEVVAA